MKIKNKNGKIIHKSKKQTITESLAEAILSNANLSGADLFGADLSNANLSNANLSDADLRCADLSSVVINKSQIEAFLRVIKIIIVK